VCDVPLLVAEGIVRAEVRDIRTAARVRIERIEDVRVVEVVVNLKELFVGQTVIEANGELICTRGGVYGNLKMCSVR